MTDIPRREIADLHVQYALEPKLRDVFVEGKFDREIITRVFQENNQTDRIVYEIDSINVPNTLVLQHGLTSGNKQRVIVLSRELAQLPKECDFRCLVDKDLDHWFGPLETTARLIWTDYCAMELYFYYDEVLKDILITTAECNFDDWDSFYESMTTVLHNIYFLRLADHELDFKLDWISFDRCLKLQAGHVVFDRTEYVKRLLMNKGLYKQLNVFEASYNQWETKVKGDHRLHIHGHDFVDMLVWSIKNNKGHKEFASKDAINRILILIAGRGSAVIQLLD